MPLNPEEILDRPQDIDLLKQFIGNSHANHPADMNQTRVASQIYLARAIYNTGGTLEAAMKAMTTSLGEALANHAKALIKSAQASEEQTRSLKRATWALVAVTFGLVILAALQIFIMYLTYK